MAPPQKTYIMCVTPRCGSHLLGEALHSTGLAGNPDEYFQPNSDGKLQNEIGHIAERYGRKTLEEFREFILDIASTDNGVAGVALHANYLHHIINAYQSLPQYEGLNHYELLNALFYNPQFIWLQRRDKVRQAVSWIKARHTGVWGSHMENRVKKGDSQALKYDYFLIEQNVARFEEFENRWRTFFEEFQIKPHLVVYEELAKEVETTTLDLLNALEIDYSKDIRFAERKLKKQADTLSEEWVQRFYRENQSFTHRLFRYARYLRFKLLPK
ncbi:MAG: Stf0 family sulfotransferase [Chloroflexota bacterium]